MFITMRRHISSVAVCECDSVCIRLTAAMPMGMVIGVLTGPAEDLNLHSIRLTGNIARKTRSLVWRKNRGGEPCLQAFIHAVEQAVQEDL